ncbi:MAG: TIGR03915 family putative DNA repair protein [Candidatus Omnitrophica bacterium]|nr:TIGR03915 family putative DNA repair protein [Candidatus Omnitrophota bacterium]
MRVFSYDGSFAGLLCCIERALSGRRLPDEITVHARAERELFSQAQCIETDEAAARQWWSFLRSRLRPSSLQAVRQVFLSGSPQKEIIIARYVAFALRAGPAADSYLTDERVAAAYTLARQVGREAHRMRGLLRFQELADGRHYARIRPEHQILPLLAPYFARRLRDRQWIIHDVGRQYAAIFDGRVWEIVAIAVSAAPQLSQEEQETAALWQRYFQDIAVGERANARLQRQCMPRRYWEFLIELPAGKYRASGRKEISAVHLRGMPAPRPSPETREERCG